jgi:hypothetical protein
VLGEQEGGFLRLVGLDGSVKNLEATPLLELEREDLLHWPVPILPWYLCYTEQERHNAQGAIVLHDGLLPGPRRPAGAPCDL